ncbi:MAG: hypothetical protein GKS03_12510 [Alphaproteobacteria bacterium]|nr:hypothetical protein [Alphaproteobacteria bacterium]
MLTRILLTRTLFAAVIAVALTAPARAMPTGDDLALLARYLWGAFDSAAQNATQSAAGIAEGERHTRVTIVHRPVGMEGFFSITRSTVTAIQQKSFASALSYLNWILRLKQSA